MCAEIVAGLSDFFTDDVPDKVQSDLREHGGWVIDDAGEVVGFVIAERRGARAAEPVGTVACRAKQHSGGDGSFAWKPAVRSERPGLAPSGVSDSGAARQCAVRVAAPLGWTAAAVNITLPAGE